MPDKYYDSCGNEIKEGDLLKVYHFRAKRRRKEWMYHVAVLVDGYWMGREYHASETHYNLRAVANENNQLLSYTVIARNLSRDEDFGETLSRTEKSMIWKKVNQYG